MIILDTHIWVWWNHKDPADRLIVSTARIYDVPLVSVDEKILAYSDVKTIQP